jgi:hypothetical protein
MSNKASAKLQKISARANWGTVRNRMPQRHSAARYISTATHRSIA